MNATREWNFDGLVGPTHHFGGLASGNLASQANARRVSNPRAAALQGLAKMKRVMDLGIPQAVLPPAPRPDLRILRQLGFLGSDRQMLTLASQDQALLEAAYSASSMWAANAATITPAVDSEAGIVQITPANLVANLHRALEAVSTTRILRAIFADPHYVTVHDPLEAVERLRDEGAANHMRLCHDLDSPGLEVFVHGPRGQGRFTPRQSGEASQALIERHRVRRPFRVVQTRRSVDAGAFHNDVVAVSHRHLLLLHEQAWQRQSLVIDGLRRALGESDGPPLCALVVPTATLSLADAVATYLFNSQIVDAPDGGMVVLAPRQCAHNGVTRDLLDTWAADPALPIRRWEAVDLDQSMRNGGGPACLRLRVVLTRAEASHMNLGVILTGPLHDRLCRWVERHYRETLSVDDLRDPTLADESFAALDALTEILELPGIYDFQSDGSRRTMY